MNFIDEKDVLNNYFKLLEQDKISFLTNNPKTKSKIIDALVKLRDESNLHERIQYAKSAWKILFEAAMSYIDPDKSGYDELFKYFDTYVDFEELIFASDSFYRDHTLHCLWVYFLGEYLYFNPEFKFIFKPMFEYKTTLKNIIDDALEMKLPEITYENLEKISHNIPDECSIRCISSLTHDLGYPLKKIKKINSSIKKILPFFGIDQFKEFDFNYQPLHMPVIQDLIYLMGMVFNFSISDNNSGSDHKKFNEFAHKYFLINQENSNFIKLNPEIKNISKDEIIEDWKIFNWKLELVSNKAVQLRYAHDFEVYEHGIMSAYILFKHLGVFRNIQITDNKNVLSIGSKERKKLFALSEIFQAIANHTSKGYKINEISGTSQILSFVDEIEEFSRISRADQNRQFINEFCKTSIENENNCFVVSFIFDNEEIANLDPERAFKGRCQKMLGLLDITNLSEDFHIKLKCIGKLPNNDKTYSLEIKNCFAEIKIDGEIIDIPSYLKSSEFFTTEEYKNFKQS